jgi:hypothetical protein
MARRNLRKAAWWQRQIDEWTRSGLGAAAFAARAGVSEQSLYRWRKRLSSVRPVNEAQTNQDESRKAGPGRRTTLRERGRGIGAEPSSVQPLQFVELDRTSGMAPVGYWAFEIVLRSGTVVRVPMEFDSNTLRRLFNALEQN